MVVGTISLDKGVVAAVHLDILPASLEDVGNGCTETEGIILQPAYQSAGAAQNTSGLVVVAQLLFMPLSKPSGMSLTSVLSVLR